MWPFVPKKTPCMKHGKCLKDYPKTFVAEGSFSDVNDGYPKYTVVTLEHLYIGANKTRLLYLCCRCELLTYYKSLAFWKTDLFIEFIGDKSDE